MTTTKQTELLLCRNCGGQCDPTGWMYGDGRQGPECEGCGITTPDVESWNKLMAQSAPEPVQGEADGIVTTWHPDSRSYEEQAVMLDTKGSRKALGAMNAKLRAKVGRLERELATIKQPLTVEPVAYAAFAENGNIRMWCRSAIGVCELFDAHGNKAVPLYTAAAKPDAELVNILNRVVDYYAEGDGDLKCIAQACRAKLADRQSCSPAE